jgi:hypothetical protein
VIEKIRIFIFFILIATELFTFKLRWVGLKPKPDFFIDAVKPKPNLCQTYLVNFSSPKKTEHKV